LSGINVEWEQLPVDRVLAKMIADTSYAGEDDDGTARYQGYARKHGRGGSTGSRIRIDNAQLLVSHSATESAVNTSGGLSEG
jgi:hypothetical protein